MDWNSLFADKDQQFLQLLLDHVSDCVIAVDTDGRVVFINEPYCQLLGGTRDDYVGQHVAAVVSSETHLHLISNGTEEAYLGILNVRGRNLVARQVPVRSDGHLVGAVGIALFTDRTQLAAFIKSSQKRDLDLHPLAPTLRSKYMLGDIFGECDLIKQQKLLIKKAATVSSPVLIYGETGTGKELMAHALHAESSRSNKPFAALNCAAIPDELVEAELFGYVGGAFTGATRTGARGKFEAADGGSLLLDEVAEMPLRSQSALLRVLQAGEIVKIGATSPKPIDVRIICATHSNLAHEVEQGRFREDLFYRLVVFEIELPPLRMRTDKIELAHYLLEQICRDLQRPTPQLHNKVCKQIRSYDWPGNVRELKATLERTLVQLDPGEHIIRQLILRPGRSLGSERASNPESGLEESMRAIERELIEKALERTGDNRTAAAHMLKINRATLYKKLHQLSIGHSVSKSG